MGLRMSQEEEIKIQPKHLAFSICKQNRCGDSKSFFCVGGAFFSKATFIFGKTGRECFLFAISLFPPSSSLQWSLPAKHSLHKFRPACYHLFKVVLNNCYMPLPLNLMDEGILQCVFFQHDQAMDSVLTLSTWR